MPFVALTAIKIPPRQRTTISPEAISQLAQSIQSQGLLHPIHIDDNFNLISGETRLKAIASLAEDKIQIRYGEDLVPLNSIPCVWHKAPTEVERKEIELAENIDRTDLPWPDRVRALAELHSLRLSTNPEQTYIQTAKEIATRSGSERTPQNISAEVSRALITSQLLSDKDVLSAGSEKLAFNLATRKIRQEFANELAQRQGGTGSKHKLIQGDALCELPKLTGGYKAFILDPPYGVGADKFGNAAAGKHEYADSQANASEINIRLIELCTPLALPDAHIWVFCDVDLLTLIRETLDHFGWQTFRTPIVWNSGTSGHIPSQKIGIRRNYELILFATRNGRGMSTILDDVVTIIDKTEKTHGAAKPEALYRLLLSQSCGAGDRVLDPTCGSGTIFRAATGLKLEATGIEMDEKYGKECEGLLAELALEKEE